MVAKYARHVRDGVVHATVGARRRIRVAHREGGGGEARVLRVERAGRRGLLQVRRARGEAGVVHVVLLVRLVLLEEARGKVRVAELRCAVDAALARRGHVRRELRRRGAQRARGRHVEVGRVAGHRPGVDGRGGVGEHDTAAARRVERIGRRERAEGGRVHARVEEVVEGVVHEHAHHLALEAARRGGVRVRAAGEAEAVDVVEERDVLDGAPLGMVWVRVMGGVRVAEVERGVHGVDLGRRGRHAGALGAGGAAGGGRGRRGRARRRGRGHGRDGRAAGVAPPHGRRCGHAAPSAGRRAIRRTTDEVIVSGRGRLMLRLYFDKGGSA